MVGDAATDDISQSTNTEPSSSHQNDSVLANGESTAIRPRTSNTAIVDHVEPTDGLSAISFNTIVVFVMFIMSLVVLLVFYTTFPQLEESERAFLKPPTSIEEAKILGAILSRYKEQHYYSVVGAIVILYMFLQTFAIPGSIFLSILCGFLFPFVLALLIICSCSACGATLCYLISHFIGRDYIRTKFPERIEAWSQIVRRQRDNLLSYIIFLRVTPFLPNWFINVAAPIVDVPLPPFWLGTFIGVGPPSFLAIRAGTVLENLSSSGVVTSSSVLILILVGLIALLPIVLKPLLKSKFE